MDTPSKIAYTVTADSTGGRAGTSSVPALGITHIMRAPKELGGPGDGANPEALFAMGYGACFQGAMGLAQALVDRAHQLCPYSKATRGNVPVTATAVATL